MSVAVCILIFQLLIVVNCDHRLAVPYDTATTLESRGQSGSISLSSLTLFNATLMFNDVRVGSCMNRLDCYLISPTVWNMNNEYKVIIIATDVKHTGETYFVVNYEWLYNGNPWEDILIILAIIATFPVAAIVSVIIVCLLCIPFIICVNCSRPEIIDENTPLMTFDDSKN